MKIRMIVLLAILVLLSACGETPSNNVGENIPPLPSNTWYELTRGGTVEILHDNINKVTCWIYDEESAGGIDCIPDWQLVAP